MKFVVLPSPVGLFKLMVNFLTGLIFRTKELSLGDFIKNIVKIKNEYIYI